MHTGIPEVDGSLLERLQLPARWWINPWKEAKRQQRLNMAQLVSIDMIFRLLAGHQHSNALSMFDACRETEVCVPVACSSCPMKTH